MRIRRVMRSGSAFVSQCMGALLKAVVTSAIVGVFLIAVMHYMGVPVPSAHDLLGGVTRWLH